MYVVFADFCCLPLADDAPLAQLTGRRGGHSNLTIHRSAFFQRARRAFRRASLPPLRCAALLWPFSYRAPGISGSKPTHIDGG